MKRKLLKSVLFSLIVPLAIGLSGCDETKPSNGNNTGNSTKPSAPIDIDDYQVTSLSIVNNPTKLEYDVGETFDYTGLRLKAIWNDGEEEEFGGYRLDSIEPSGPLKATDKKVTLTYYNASVDLDITVNSNAITSLYVDTSDIKTSVVVNEIVDLSLIKVTANYGDSTSREVTSFELYENDTLIENPNRYVVSKGKHNIVIKYLDAQTSFEVEGYEGISVVFDQYSKNDTAKEATSELPFFVEPANKVKSYNPSNWNEEVTINSYALSTSQGIDSIKALAKVRIHIYSEKDSYASISLNAGGYNITRPDKGWTSDMYLNKATSVTVNGQNVEVKEGLLPANYKNGEMLSRNWTPYFVDVDFIDTWLKKGDNIIEIDVNEFYHILDPFQNQRYGEVYFAIKSLTAKYIEGQKKVTKIEVAKQPDKTTYAIGETFDNKGMEVKAYYDDLSSEIITNYTYSHDALKATDKEVVISYMGVSTTISITVSHAHNWIESYLSDKDNHWHECSLCGEKKDISEHTFTSLIIKNKPTQLDYNSGDTLSLNGINVMANCNVCNEVDVSNYITTITTTLELSSPSLTLETKTITITFKGLSATFDVTIHKSYSVAGKNRQDPTNTTEKYYVEKAEMMENGKWEFQGSSDIANVEVGATIAFHIYSEINGKVNLSLLAGSLYCNGNNKNAEGFYLETMDMDVDKLLAIKVKNGSNNFKEVASNTNAKINGHKLPENYKELGISSTVWAMNQYSWSTIASNIDLTIGDNVIEFTILNAKTIGNYTNAWGGVATLNIRMLAVSFMN